MDFSVQKFKPLCDFFEVLMNFSRIASFCKKTSIIDMGASSVKQASRYMPQSKLKATKKCKYCVKRHREELDEFIIFFKT